MSEIRIRAYCGGACDKPFGWFVVERWEKGRVFSRGYVCGAGCLIATAHSQRDRDPATDPITKGLLKPVVDERVIEVGEQPHNNRGRQRGVIQALGFGNDFQGPDFRERSHPPRSE